MTDNATTTLGICLTGLFCCKSLLISRGPPYVLPKSNLMGIADHCEIFTYWMPFLSLNQQRHIALLLL